MRAFVLLVVLLVGAYAAFRAVPPPARRVALTFLGRHFAPVLLLILAAGAALVAAAVFGPIPFFTP